MFEVWSTQPACVRFDPVAMSFSMTQQTPENEVMCGSLQEASFSLKDVNNKCWHSYLKKKTEGVIPFHKIIWDVTSIQDRKFVDRQCEYFLDWTSRNGRKFEK